MVKDFSRLAHLDLLNSEYSGYLYFFWPQYAQHMAKQSSFSMHWANCPFLLFHLFVVFFARFMQISSSFLLFELN